jgi:hypothetical protein
LGISFAAYNGVLRMNIAFCKKVVICIYTFKRELVTMFCDFLTHWELVGVGDVEFYCG